MSDVYERLRKRLDDLVEGLAEWADYNPDQKVVVEYKAFEPRTHIMLPTIGHCMTVINEINRPNLGINIDMGHALIMKENLAESIALCCRYGKLFHTHWNDNWKMFDDDVIVGTVNLWETLEALFWLDEWGYDGWYGPDLVRTASPQKKAVDESTLCLWLGSELLDCVTRDELRECFQTSKATRTHS